MVASMARLRQKNSQSKPRTASATATGATRRRIR
jgi:hypothetical protein